MWLYPEHRILRSKTGAELLAAVMCSAKHPYFSILFNSFEIKYALAINEFNNVSNLLI